MNVDNPDNEIIWEGIRNDLFEEIQRLDTINIQVMMDLNEIGYNEKIRICLPFYLSLDYVCNNISKGAKRNKMLKQSGLIPKMDLFS